MAAGRGGGRRPLALADLAAAPPVADLADTVFAISPSTLAPDLRYIKHLKNRNAPLLSEEGWTPFFGGRGGGRENDEHNVITCQIGRDQSINISSDGQEMIYLPPRNPHSATRTPQSGSPFLGLTYIGLTLESIHLTDLTKQTRLATTREQKLQLQARRRSTSVYEYILTAEYARYLER